MSNHVLSSSAVSSIGSCSASSTVPSDWKCMISFDRSFCPVECALLQDE